MLTSLHQWLMRRLGRKKIPINWRMSEDQRAGIAPMGLAGAGKRDAMASEALGTLLADPSADARRGAAIALARLGIAGRERLLAAIHHVDPEVAESAYWGLAWSAGPLRLDIQLDLFEAKVLGYGRIAALGGLGKYIPDPSVVDAALRRWDMEILDERVAIQGLLIKWCAFDRSRILPRLIRELEESSNPSLLYLIANLRDIAPEPLEAVPALRRFLAVDSPGERLSVEAAYTLSKMNSGREHLAHQLVELLETCPNWLSKNCSQFQGEIPFTPWSSFLELLATLMQPEDQARIREVASAAASQIEDPQARKAGLDLLTKLGKHELR